MIWRRLKNDDGYKEDPEFRKAIDEAMKRLHLQERDIVASLKESHRETEMENHEQTNHPTLDNINPYDGDPETQDYLHLSCRYLAHEQAKKYESESVQESVESDYYHSCLNAIWPGHTYHLHVT